MNKCKFCGAEGPDIRPFRSESLLNLADGLIVAEPDRYCSKECHEADQVKSAMKRDELINSIREMMGREDAPQFIVSPHRQTELEREAEARQGILTMDVSFTIPQRYDIEGPLDFVKLK